MNMEFLTRNYLNTTTSINPSDGTASALYLFDRKSTTEFSAAGTLTAYFTVNNSIDRIVMENTNYKSFSITHVSGTALSLITGSDTSTVSYTGNSATSLYLVLASTTSVNTLTMIVSSATSAGNVTLGQLWFCGALYEVERNPSVDDFKIARDRREYVHKLADGGTAQYILDTKYAMVDMKWEFFSATGTASLETVYNQNDAIVFVPYPTITSDWQTATNAKIYEYVWTGKFGFDQPSFNVKEEGYSGRITLEETAK